MSYQKYNDYLFCNLDHEKLSLHGRGKHWDRFDVERIMHKLVLEGYLREEMVASKIDIINAFVRVGPEAEKLLRGSIKVNYFYNSFFCTLIKYFIS